MFGLPAEDDGSRDDVMLGQNLVSVHALRARRRRRCGRRRRRIVLAAGAESDGELANRGAHAVAERLGTAPSAFPGGHGGLPRW